ncbi:MAG: insulinase family protein [Bdellovibrio sp.]|nr:insulinase family protein [Bdellovibrio sp.]
MYTLKKILIMFTLFNLSSVFWGASRAEDFTKNIKKYDWNGLEVTWLQDERLPLYQILIYFADGALSDDSGGKSVTNAMFSLLDAGTRRYTQKDISENLEYFGVEYGAYVTHEYSTYAISGPVKDIVPTMKQICHLFSEATFPAQEIKREVQQAESTIYSMINNHGSLASHIFRELSLQGSPYNYPVVGKLKDLKKLNTKTLLAKLDYFNKNVKKKIYISGPERALIVREIINEECGWKGQGATFERNMVYDPVLIEKPRVVFVSVPKANQAQIRIGRFLNREEIKNAEMLDLVSNLLGGGFTSLLMKAVRSNEGLTYNVSAFAAGQKEYGRSVVSSFTKNETVIPLLEVVRNTLDQVAKREFNLADFERMKSNLIGSHPFAFEKSSALLTQLATLDHSGRPYSDLADFPAIVQKFGPDDTAKAAHAIFDWNRQTILILGDESLKKKIKELGEFESKSYKDFL